MALVGEMNYLEIGGNTYSIPSGSSVSITRNLTSGTKSATINVDGTDYDIYSETNTDTKVTQTPLNGANSSYGLLFSPLTGSTQHTDTVYTSYKIAYSDYSQTLYIYNSDRTKSGYYKFNELRLANSATSYTGLLKTAGITAARTYTLPDATGTIALTSDIPSIPTNISSFTNDAGYITSSDIPVTSVNGNTGAVTVVEDDHKWGGVTLGASGSNTAAKAYVPVMSSMGNTSGTASWATVTSTPTNYCIAKYDDGPYLYSTTPTSSDSSTKVATTAFVAGVAVTQASINSSGLITYKNSSGTSLFTLQLPLYDGGVS